MYNVLLVDDEPLAIQGLELLVDWESFGFQIAGSCDNGEEALSYMRACKPDLVVTDIRMPVMDGLTLIELARLEGFDTPFVIVSGFGEFEYARRGLQLGVTRYLTKPLWPEEVSETLSGLSRELEERRKAESIHALVERHNLQQSLSSLLYGTYAEEMDDELFPELAAVSAAANGWIYFHVETEEGELAAARTACLKLMQERRPVFLLDYHSRAFGLLYGCAEQGEAEVRRFGNELCECVGASAAQTFRIAAGIRTDGLSQISRSYAAAAEAGLFFFFEQEKRLIYYEDIKHRKLSYSIRIIADADRIAAWIDQGEGDRLKEAVHAVFCTFKKNFVSPELVELFVAECLHRCFHLLQECGGDPGWLTEQSWERFSSRNKRLDELAASLLAISLQCIDALAELRKKSSSGTIDRIDQYIRQHYREALTVKEIAARFYVHPVYLGQAYSRKFGKGIVDAIHHCRIEEAMKRLRGQDETISGIAESVGYNNYQYFLKQFEKRTGMKPAAFRQAWRDGDTF